MFDTYCRLLQFLKKNRQGNQAIESFRRSLLTDRTLLKVHDLGAGSKKVPQARRSVADITRYSTSGPKFAQLYQFFASLTPAQTILEFGTCVGISTRYLSDITRGKLVTFEGSPEIQKIAKTDPLPARTEFILGPIEHELPTILQSITTVDFALIDANHTYAGTINTFRTLLPKVCAGTIVAIGDIHWSPDMEQAWEEIKAHPSVQLTLDFFECGIIFFHFPGRKSHLILDI